MVDREQVCVLLPTLDEAATIGDAVESFRERGFDHVLVVDGGSEDGTRELAREAGAEVLVQSGSGKGQAVREALDAIDQPHVLMADGDGTYRAADADRMLAPLFEGRVEHVIGNRFADMEPDAMSRLNRIGNRLINLAFRTVHHRELTDILSGYRAFTVASAERMNLSEDGFGIETEMAVECAKNGIETVEVPITYRARPEGSETNLSPLVHGALIGVTIYKLAKTNNPLFYFGSVGGISLGIGAIVAAFVGYEWFVHGIGHEAMAVVASAAILLGVQLLMFGVLSDMIVSLHREQLRRIEQVRSDQANLEPAEPQHSLDETEPDREMDATASPDSSLD